MKICTKCKVPKEHEEFHKSSKTKDGLKCQCKTCTLAGNKAREPLYNEYRKRYRAENKEEYRTKKKKYYKENKQKILDSNRSWRKTLNGRLLSYQRGAKSRNYSWNLSREEFESFWQKSCFYCNSQIETIGIDRIDSTKDYFLSNCVPCCERCNTMKRDYSHEDFTNSIIKIYNNLKLWEHTKKLAET